MNLEINSSSKCCLCKQTFIEGEEVTYFADINGSIRVAHKQCYNDKYMVE